MTLALPSGYSGKKYTSSIGASKPNWEVKDTSHAETGNSLFHTFYNAIAMYANEQFLGTIVDNGAGGLQITWQTYKEVWQCAVVLASGLRHLTGDSYDDIISLFSKNRKEWVYTDLAIAILGWSSVPIPTAINDPGYILDHASVTTLVVGKAYLPRILELLDDIPKLRLIVQMERMEQDEYDKLVSDLSTRRKMFHASTRSPKGGPIPRRLLGGLPTLMIVDMHDLEKIGKLNLMAKPNLSHNEDEKTWTIVYTSGTTGKPKGVVNTYSRWNRFISHAYPVPQPLVRVSFLPMALNTERHLFHLTILVGGQMVFSRGDDEKLFEEFGLVNPTATASAPSFYDTIFAKFQAELSKYRRENPKVGEEESEEIVLGRFKTFLGNRLDLHVIGGAAVAPVTLDFVNKCFPSFIFEGYGNTEAGLIIANRRVFPGSEVLLVDHPEIGCTKDCQPYPRGELWTKSPFMSTGYFKNEQANLENFKDGWFCTGDIAEARENEEYVILDRVKNFFTLTTGTVVAPTFIETTLIASDLIEQNYVYGDGTRSKLVAIVVPNFPTLARWAVEEAKVVNGQEFLATIAAKGSAGGMSDSEGSSVDDLLERHRSEFCAYLCQNAACINKVLQDIVQVGADDDLPSELAPAAVHLEHVKWTPESQLMTASYKLQRGALQRHYQDVIDALYAKLNA